MKRVLAVAAVVGLALLVWSVWNREIVTDWMRGARPLPFFALMAILPAAGAPLTPFFILAGASFGVRVGLLGSVLALALNLALCYWIASSRLRPQLVALLRRFGHELPSFRGRGKETLRFTLLVKLMPGVPGFVKNYGLGVAGVPFTPYFVASMLMTGTYALALIVLGDSLLDHDLERTTLVAGLLLSLAVVVWWLRRRRRLDVGGARPRHA